MTRFERLLDQIKISKSTDIADFKRVIINNHCPADADCDVERGDCHDCWNREV